MNIEPYLIALIGVGGAILGGIATKLGEVIMDEIRLRRRRRKEIKFADIEDIRKLNWSGEKFLKELIKLDLTTMEADPNGSPIDSVHEGTPEQWAPVFTENPNTWSLLIEGRKTIIGYWHFVALDDETFERAKRGELNDSEITSETIVSIDAFGVPVPGIYNLYFVFIGTSDSFMDHGKWRLALFNDFLTKLTTLAEQGVFFREICANAVTTKSEILCGAKGMRRGAPHISKRGTIYSRELVPWPRELAHSRFQRLEELYSSGKMLT